MAAQILLYTPVRMETVRQDLVRALAERFLTLGSGIIYLGIQLPMAITFDCLFVSAFGILQI